MMRIRWIAGCLLGAWALAAAAQTPVEPSDVVLVVVKPRANLDKTLVTVADVADVQGGTATLRNKIAWLDLAALSPVQPEALLPREQLSFRLQLAGISPKSFRIVGATHVLVRFATKVSPSVPKGDLQLTSGQSPVMTKAEPVAEQPVLIKNRDIVRLRARIGAFEVTARGEAMQDGRAGQNIRVRNVDSNKIVAGRVVDARLVDVDY